MNPLQQLHEYGQSPWLDFLNRDLVRKGELRRLIQQEGVRGLTSNPSIFAKAIGETDQYDDLLVAAAAKPRTSIDLLYEQLAIEDIRGAADVLRPVYDESFGNDGYVSLEVSPFLANDTKATIDEGRRLWQAVARDNLMIKVPATAAGIPAVRKLIGEGINVNITLLFSVDVYEEVVDAYMGGLEDLAANGGEVAKLASVASFFVSRIDAAIDKRLKALPEGEGKEHALKTLKGKAAIANAKLAYQRSLKLHGGERWAKLREVGARRQRLLWASTSVKDPAYPDTLYVDTLVGPETVNTMPTETLKAYGDHGKPVRDAIAKDAADAAQVIEELDRLGISLAMVAKQLTEDGVKLFKDAFDGLLRTLADKVRDHQAA